MLEYIVKYRGDIVTLAEGLGGSAEILSPSFALVLLPKDINLYDYEEIEYAELSEPLYYQLESGKRASCFNEIIRENSELTGEGVLIGIIDSGIDSSLPQFEGKLERLLFGAENDYKGHGTVTAGIIASLAPEARLIIARAGSGNYVQSIEIMRAVSEIIKIANGRALVINISYGTNYGAHTGLSLFEQYLDEVSSFNRILIVVASGNEGSSAHHFGATVTQGGELRAEIKISGEQTNIPVYISKSFADNILIKILAPNGEEAQGITGGFRYLDTLIYYSQTQPTPYTIGTQINLSFIGTPIENGIWTIIFEGKEIIDGRIDAWLPVSELTGTNTIFLSSEPNSSLTIPSTAYRVLTVGAFNPTTLAAADFSGRGYTSQTYYVKPDILAPGVDIKTYGIGGTISSYSGTSVAAPFAAAAAALLMQWGIVLGNDKILYGERLKAFLRLGAIRENGVYPNPVYGYGRLCVNNTLSLLKQARLQSSYGEQSIRAFQANETIDLVVEYSPALVRQLDELGISYKRLLYSNELLITLGTEYYNALLDGSGVPVLLAPSEIGGTAADSIQLSESANIYRLQQQPIELSGRGVIIAIIDTGIDYNLPQFLYANGESRIYSIWDMTINGNPPEGFDFGTEYNNEEISNGEALTDDPLNHGTQLALAAGGSEGAAPNADIVVVKLRQANSAIRQLRAVPEDVNAYTSSDFILGIEYVFSVAEKLHRPVSLVVGMGTNEGGHNGQSRFERYITTNSVRAGVFISVAAGNEASAEHHAKITIFDNFAEVEIRIAENESLVPVYVWNSLPSELEVGIVSPLGEEIARLPVTNNLKQQFRLNLTQTRVTIVYYRPASGTADQETVIVFEAPASGIWRIRLYSNAEIVHLWLPVSEFLKPATAFLSPDSFTTATIPSTAIDTACIGAYNPSSNAVYPSSGRGPSRDGRSLPSLVAPSPGSTSVAAAVCAGAAALFLEWGFVKGNNLSLNTPSICAFFESGAKRSSASLYPDNIAGYGRLDAYEAFRDI